MITFKELVGISLAISFAAFLFVSIIIHDIAWFFIFDWILIGIISITYLCYRQAYRKAMPKCMTCYEPADRNCKCYRNSSVTPQ